MHQNKANCHAFLGFGGGATKNTPHSIINTQTHTWMSQEVTKWLVLDLKKYTNFCTWKFPLVVPKCVRFGNFCSRFILEILWYPEDAKLIQRVHFERMEMIFWTHHTQTPPSPTTPPSFTTECVDIAGFLHIAFWVGFLSLHVFCGPCPTPACNARVTSVGKI